MKLRPIIIIVVTLLIGFCLGMLTSAQLRHKRMKSVRIYTSEHRFREDAYRFLQPNEDQIEKLDPIIKKYAKQNGDLQREYRRNFEDLMQKYFAEVKPVLTDEQLDMISEIQKKRREATRRFRPDSLNTRRHPDDSSMERNRRGGTGGPGGQDYPGAMPHGTVSRDSLAIIDTLNR